MLRYMGIIILFCGCSFIGIRASNKLHNRQQALDLFRRDIRRLLLLMEYTVQPLDLLCNRLSGGDLGCFWHRFATLLNEAENVPAAWKQALALSCRENSLLAALEQEELSILEDFSCELGGGNQRVQQSNGKLLEQRLDTVLQQAQNAYTQKAKIYRAMGVLCGIAVSILVI